MIDRRNLGTQCTGGAGSLARIHSPMIFLIGLRAIRDRCKPLKTRDGDHV
jgi:hypothetical protein